MFVRKISFLALLFLFLAILFPFNAVNAQCGLPGSVCCPGGGCSPGTSCSAGGICSSTTGGGGPTTGSGSPDVSGGCIETAIGCIPVIDPGGQGIAEFFLSWGIGIGGGIALVMIAYSGYLIMTASGDPRKLQAGKELLTAAISGLMLLVLSAYILRVVGQDILQIF